MLSSDLADIACISIHAGWMLGLKIKHAQVLAFTVAAHVRGLAKQKAPSPARNPSDWLPLCSAGLALLPAQQPARAV